ncbi:hypothetical protein NYQ35_16680 [Curtobacterium flaccumfaciens pv. flaccumfaciens]|uniref:hypothetical protein n=1 Tax=Curtobacterium TaxID=2034 RepID=UPI00217DF8D0|nr:hypothetical protein [Curtobacterium flaccumfaciens]MCS6553312.1 hypothetical protein [Curtobacterium flaccumfaciens pv. flaccumfaciens]MCS6567132.1 hypothetical protein [Curtobacterium flaccumfaciens pv. flaccumfaciens]MCS6570438.1 hypothetical protein [Curtobacterium flaccumfaciens pv. flaccumfaciens]MCS6586879.1 hypothetical protein [Curtobacterium flaccumfaciens pv. flaccumfaciens]
MDEHTRQCGEHHRANAERGEHQRGTGGLVDVAEPDHGDDRAEATRADDDQQDERHHVAEAHS